MSYGLKYTITAAAKTEPVETSYLVEIYEKDYAGATSELENGLGPIQGQILASSDDPFDPVLASSITLLVDVTDFTGDLPDFVTTDDRKYWVKILNGTYYVWQGFIINESITLPFISGRTFLSILCTDGLAMLKNIPYEPTDPDINVDEDLSTVITNCLNQIELPNGYLVNYCCGIYADGMVTSASVFKQAYYAPRNWMKESPKPLPAGSPIGVTPASPYMSCYEVLSTIAFSFGCQIFQSYGEWWIANVNERGEDSIRLFQTTQANGAETVTVRFTQRTITAYQNTTDTPWFFQAAQQTKILRKGYGSFEFRCDAAYAPNMADNGAMVDIDGTFPRNWSAIGIGGVTLSSLGPYNAINMAPTGGGPTLRTVGAYNESNAPCYIGDKFTMSFLLDGQPTISVVPKCRLQIILTTPAVVQYFMDEDGNWSTTLGYIDVIGSSTATYESKSYTSQLFPESGTLRINFICDNFDTLTATIANLQLRYSNVYDYRLVRTSLTNELYKKEVSFVMGGPSDQFNYSQKGSIVDSNGDTLENWYRFGISEAYDDLTRLVAQQYYNIQSRACINVSGTLKNLIDTRDVIVPPKKIPHVVGCLDNITITDTTGKLSISGKHFVPGAVNIDYSNDTINGTFLEVSNTDIEVDFYDNLIINA